MQPQEVNTTSDTKIWMVLIGIIIFFVLIIIYAQHITKVRQGEPVPVVARYTNYAYGVNLRYPPEWQPVGGLSFDRYEGESGFFSISAGGEGNVSIDELAKSEANNSKKPYGSEPYIQTLAVDGQDARLILPSLDQSPSMHGQAVLIAKYPTPKMIGPATYKYLVFWADRANIQDIASSLTFVE